LLAIPIALWVLPSTFFDNGQSLCLSVLLLNKSCIGCGITRAVQHFIHGEFKVGFNYNHLVILVLPLLIFMWGKMVVSNWKHLNKKNHSKF
jgi:hypothetical protein